MPVPSAAAVFKASSRVPQRDKMYDRFEFCVVLCSQLLVKLEISLRFMVFTLQVKARVSVRPMQLTCTVAESDSDVVIITLAIQPE